MKSTVVILIVITILAFFLRVHGINYYSYGDEHGHLYNALGLASGQLPRNFHRIALFGFYGVFFILGWVMGFFHNPTQFIGTFYSNMHLFYYAGRFFEVLTGTASVVLLYFLGKKMFSRATGLAAALFLAVSPAAVELSRKARGQALCLLLITAAIYFAYTAIAKKRKWPGYLLAGLCFGAAFSIRIFSAIVVVPVLYFYLTGVFREQRQRRAGFYAPAGPKIVEGLKNVVFNAGLWFFIIGGVFAFFVSDPTNFLRFPARLSIMLANISVGSGETSMYLGSEIRGSLDYYLKEGLPLVLGYPLYVFSAVAFLVGLFRFKRPNYLLLILTSVSYVLIMGRGSIASARYLMPIYPMIFLIAGDFLATGSGLICKSGRRATLLCLGAAFLLAVPALRTSHRQNRQHRLRTTKDLAEEWIFSNFPSGTRIAVESMGYRGPDLKLTPVIDYWIYNLSEEELKDLLAERLREGQPSFALRHFIENPPYPKYYTTTISVREIIDVERLKEERYQYIVTSLRNREIYEREITQLEYPEHYRARLEFYSWLEEEGELIKEFRPDENTPGDKLRVYRVRED